MSGLVRDPAPRSVDPINTVHALTSPRTPPKLPNPPTPLVGRADVLAAARDRLLAEDVRLLTLIGPAGVGKTRLALALAGLVAATDHFPDGVLFVDLAPLTSPDLVLPAIARELEIQLGGDPPLDVLCRRLATQRVLLLLDNFEHLLSSPSEAAGSTGDTSPRGTGPLLARVLQVCPHVKLLVTSRAALQLRWEHLFPVPPLDVPTPGRLPDIFTLARSPAVTLFEQRARAVDPTFALRQENASAIVELCARLEGLPLAIELAAARSALLSPQTIVAHLTHRRLGALDLRAAGVDGIGDWPARHQTLRAAIAWSYDLLSSEEQALFRRLAVFAGGCTAAAAHAIVSSTISPTGDEAGTLDRLLALTSRSLLRRDAQLSAHPRFSMLETIREYALERLHETDEARDTRARHAAYFLALAETEAALAASGASVSIMPPPWDSLAHEHDNLRAALAWYATPEATPGATSGDASDGLRLAAALHTFWLRHGYLSEGRAALRAFLDHPSPAPTITRADALDRSGALARAQGDYAAARAAHAEALAIRRRAGNPTATAETLTHLGWTAEQTGDDDAAQRLYAEGLELYREVQDVSGIAHALTCLGKLAHARRDFPAARTLLEEAISVRREAGRKQETSTLIFLGNVHAEAGDDALAVTCFEAALAAYRDAADTLGEMWAINSLARLRQQRHDIAGARDLYTQALALARATGDTTGISVGLNNLAHLAYLTGDLAAVHALGRERLHYARAGGVRHNIAGALTQLGNAELDLSASRGERADTDAAAAYFHEALTIWREESARASSGWARGAAGAVHFTPGALRFREGQVRFWEQVDAQSLATCLAGLARIALRQAKANSEATTEATIDHAPLVRAALLLGAGAEVVARAGTHCRAIDDLSPHLRALIGEHAWDVAWTEGRALPRERLLTLAIAAAASLAPATATAAPVESPLGFTISTAAPTGPLTEREREVAALVARGLTNRQIATALRIAEGTARAHLAHILVKLGADRRAQVAAWAVEEGLLTAS